MAIKTQILKSAYTKEDKKLMKVVFLTRTSRFIDKRIFKNLGVNCS